MDLPDTTQMALRFSALGADVRLMGLRARAAARGRRG